MDNKAPFPQADDFDKVIALIERCNNRTLNDNRFVSSVLGEISDRQVMYYLSAVAYLGIIRLERGCREFTEYGCKIKEMSTYIREIELISIILKLPVFSKVFVLEKKIGHQTCDDVSSLIKEAFPEFSDSICERRAQTVIKWIEWVNNKLNDN